MPTVETPAEAYQDLARIRQRIDYEPDDFFAGGNAALRFDELLVEFEEEARGIFETLWGDQTPLEETDREDTLSSVASDPALTLVYPINDVTQVEYKISEGSDWQTMDADRYKHTSHHLILSERPTANVRRHRGHSNPLTKHSDRAGWGDWAEKLRVTYDRGYGESPPSDILSIQVQLINNMLRARKREQTVAAASPEEFAGQTETNEIVTDEIRSRVADVTTPGMATMSI